MLDKKELKEFLTECKELADNEWQTYELNENGIVLNVGYCVDNILSGQCGMYTIEIVDDSENTVIDNRLEHKLDKRTIKNIIDWIVGEE